MALRNKNESKLVKQPRRRKEQEYRRFRYNKRIKHPAPPLPPARKILWRSLKLLWQSRRAFSWMLIVYGILSLVFVHGIGSTTQLVTAKSLLLQVNGDSAVNQFGTGLSLFGNLIGSSASAAGGAGYQTVLLLVMSLVVIWALRTTYAGKERVRAKMAFYKGMAPTVPFVLIFLVICLELIPFLASTQLYAVVSNNGLAITALEKFLWGFLVFSMTLWSFYMVSSTALALYVVTLPDATPIKAMQVAKNLVRYRRWTVLRKFLYLPFALTIIVGGIMLPVVLWLTPAADWTFFVLGLSIIFIVHAYYFTLYKELI